MAHGCQAPAQARYAPRRASRPGDRRPALHPRDHGARRRLHRDLGLGAGRHRRARRRAGLRRGRQPTPRALARVWLAARRRLGPIAVLATAPQGARARASRSSRARRGSSSSASLRPWSAGALLTAALGRGGAATRCCPGSGCCCTARAWWPAARSRCAIVPVMGVGFMVLGAAGAARPRRRGATALHGGRASAGCTSSSAAHREEARWLRRDARAAGSEPTASAAAARPGGARAPARAPAARARPPDPRARAPGHRERARGQRDAHLQRAQGAARDHRRQPERARAQARGGRVHRRAPSRSRAGVPQTEYRLTPLGRRALERYLDHMEALIRATRDTLSTDAAHLFLGGYFMIQSTLPSKSPALHVAIIMDGNGRWAAARGLPAAGRAPRGRAAVAARRRGRAGARHRHAHALRLLRRQLEAPARPRSTASCGSSRDVPAAPRPRARRARRALSVDRAARPAPRRFARRSTRPSARPPRAARLHLRLAVDYSARDTILRAAAIAAGTAARRATPSRSRLGDAVRRRRRARTWIC